MIVGHFDVVEKGGRVIMIGGQINDRIESTTLSLVEPLTKKSTNRRKLPFSKVGCLETLSLPVPLNKEIPFFINEPIPSTRT